MITLHLRDESWPGEGCFRSGLTKLMTARATLDVESATLLESRHRQVGERRAHALRVGFGRVRQRGRATHYGRQSERQQPEQRLHGGHSDAKTEQQTGLHALIVMEVVGVAGGSALERRDLRLDGEYRPPAFGH